MRSPNASSAPLSHRPDLGALLLHVTAPLAWGHASLSRRPAFVGFLHFPGFFVGLVGQPGWGYSDRCANQVVKVPRSSCLTPRAPGLPTDTQVTCKYPGLTRIVFNRRSTSSLQPDSPSRKGGGGISDFKVYRKVIRASRGCRVVGVHARPAGHTPAGLSSDWWRLG